MLLFLSFGGSKVIKLKMIPKTIIAGIEDKIIIVFNEIYKKIKASQGNIFTAPMASGGGAAPF